MYLFLTRVPCGSRVVRERPHYGLDTMLQPSTSTSASPNFGGVLCTAYCALLEVSEDPQPARSDRAGFLESKSRSAPVTARGVVRVGAAFHTLKRGQIVNDEGDSHSLTRHGGSPPWTPIRRVRRRQTSPMRRDCGPPASMEVWGFIIIDRESTGDSMDFLLEMFNKPFTHWRWEQQLVVVSVIIIAVLLVIYSITALARRTRGVRADPRRPMSGPIEVSWKYGPSLEWHSHGRCLDVSAGGLKMELPDPIDVFERIRFRVIHADLAGTASVRHCSRVGANYVIGVKFHRLRR